MGACTTDGLRIFRRFERYENEEGVGAALDGPKKVGAGGTLSGATAPTSCNLRAPMVEMADTHVLQPCDHFGRPGPSPGWGTTSFPSRNLCDTTL